jgi:uroporphyrinogen-III synthase
VTYLTADVYYDILAFFSPTGIKSLYKNLTSSKTILESQFWKYYTKEALDHGLRVDILAPTPNTPSMTMALEKYIAEANKGK